MQVPLGPPSFIVEGFCMRDCPCLYLYMVVRLIWKVERSRNRAVQMDNLRSLLGIRRMDKVQYTWITELWSDEN